MFKHILLPTDGSGFSDRAVRHGILLAKSLDAKVTLLSVVPEFRMTADESFALPMSASLKKRYEKAAKTRAENMLTTVERKLARAGLKSKVVVAHGDFPYQQIVAAARRGKCDLIVMASHGRRGLAGLLLGSETLKVLTHGRIPVLVVR